MKKKLVILGGSSPFTAALIDALLPVCHELPVFELVLYGRNESNLHTMLRYADRLREHGWILNYQTNLAAALVGADVVLHQIRYGDLTLREAGESFCAARNLPADETLGPAALMTALVTRDSVQHTITALHDHCPHAHIINLTNPLSYVTGLMAATLPQTVGLCELPLYTIHKVADRLKIPRNKLSWHYVGLNHRGFIHTLRYGQRDLIAELASNTKDLNIGGISAATIAQLGALPLKYFRLFVEPKPSPPGRAIFLEQLRARILTELKSNPTVSPPSLKQRYQEWYPLSVVPYLIALFRKKPSMHVVNLPQKDGLVRELVTWVSRDGITVPEQTEELPQPVKQWLTRLDRHERAFLLAAEQQSYEHIQAAITADPTIAAEIADETSRDLWLDVIKWSTLL